MSVFWVLLSLFWLFTLWVALTVDLDAWNAVLGVGIVLLLAAAMWLYDVIRE